METERLKDTYGYPDRKFKSFKVLNNSVFCTDYVTIGNKFKFKLYVDRIQQKLFLDIYNKNGKILEHNTYWDFDSLKEKLDRKLKILAYVNAIKKYKNKKVYFKYTKIKFYKFKSFEAFLSLLETGKIRITFKVGIYKSGPKFGKTYDHGTGFDIKEEDLLELYDEITL